jgi:hypothetical protein
MWAVGPKYLSYFSGKFPESLKLKKQFSFMCKSGSVSWFLLCISVLLFRKLDLLCMSKPKSCLIYWLLCFAFLIPYKSYLRYAVSAMHASSYTCYKLKVNLYSSIRKYQIYENRLLLNPKVTGVRDISFIVEVRIQRISSQIPVSANWAQLSYLYQKFSNFSLPANLSWRFYERMLVQTLVGNEIRLIINIFQGRGK